MNQHVSCCIIGDINIDYITNLSHVSLDGSINPCLQNPVISSVGGNAVFFAEAASEADFQNVSVLCSTGDDIASSCALEHLRCLGVVVYNFPGSQQTGQVIIIYQPNDQRIMIADRGANRDFMTIDSSVCLRLAEMSDLLYVSGYMLLDRDQRSAVHTIADVFRARGAKVLVDMVPHDIWQTKSWRSYVDICSCADCVAAEMTSIVSFHRKSDKSMSPEEAADLLLEHFAFCLIRINDVSDFIVADRNWKRIVSIPYQRVTASLRFTDCVIAHVMQQYLEAPRLLFESDLWLTKVISAVGEAA